MIKDNTVSTDNRITIENFISYRSKSLNRYIQNKRVNSYFTLWYKSLTK